MLLVCNNCIVYPQLPGQKEQDYCSEGDEEFANDAHETGKNSWLKHVYNFTRLDAGFLRSY
jgi:hypothetical protein